MSSANLRTFEELVAFLVKQQFPHTVDPANRIVQLPSKAAPLPGNLMIKWHAHMPFIQIVHYMIENVPETRVRALETALCRLNHLYEVPCFGLDHDARRLYYRITMPVFPTDGLNPTTLNALGQGCVKAAREFLEPLSMIVNGRPGEEMDAVLAEVSKARAPGQAPPA